MNLRSFHHGDEQLFLDLVNRTYRNLESLTVERVRRLLSQPFFDPRGFFIAEEKGIAVGCIGVFNARARKCLSGESGLTTTFTVFLEENGKN
jgi:hypothetical protein